MSESLAGKGLGMWEHFPSVMGGERRVEVVLWSRNWDRERGRFLYTPRGCMLVRSSKYKLDICSGRICSRVE